MLADIRLLAPLCEAGLTYPRVPDLHRGCSEGPFRRRFLGHAPLGQRIRSRAMVCPGGCHSSVYMTKRELPKRIPIAAAHDMLERLRGSPLGGVLPPISNPSEAGDLTSSYTLRHDMRSDENGTTLRRAMRLAHRRDRRTEEGQFHEALSQLAADKRRFSFPSEILRTRLPGTR